MTQTIESAQEYLREAHIDGWLLRDYFDANPIFWNVLGGHANNVTRPCWLFIPADGAPTLLAHGVDAGRFTELWDELGGMIAPVTSYSSRASLIDELTALLADSSTIAMEYSPEDALPRVGRTGAGSIELIRNLGVDVVSSGNVLQHATERWSPEQLDSHRYAAERLTTIVHTTFDFVSENINWKLTEHDLAEFIRGRFDRLGLTTTDGPAVAVNAHSSDPHYEPQPVESAVLRRGSWLLIDLWARQKDMPDSMYADITWTAFLGDSPSVEHRHVFDAVISGRDAAVEFIQERVTSGEPIEGWEADRRARDVISAAGFGDEFIHRLGHSLGRTVHSNAVNLDSWETHDTRNLVPGLGITVEPGVYTEEFGVRSEIDLYIDDGAVEITTDPQTEIYLIGV